MTVGPDYGGLGYDLGYLRHGSFGLGYPRWPGGSRRGPLDAMAGLARCLVARRWRRATGPSCGPRWRGPMPLLARWNDYFFCSVAVPVVVPSRASRRSSRPVRRS